ncbi:hypothetical protein ONZ45_g10374 [Pleurotus djamor]|nr:hypothetical protein ONZ45_g10374 [Pleurotus djamor]
MSTTYKPIEDLPSEGYAAGPSLFPGRIIAGCNEDIDKYDADTWTAHVLRWCTDTFPTGAVTVAAYSAMNAGTGGRGWIGYAFHGVANADDFKKASSGDVKDLHAFTRTS